MLRLQCFQPFLFVFCVFWLFGVVQRFLSYQAAQGFQYLLVDFRLLGVCAIALDTRIFQDFVNPLRIPTPGGIPFWRAVYLLEETFECSFTNIYWLLIEDLEKFETTYIPKSGEATPEVLCSQICFCM